MPGIQGSRPALSGNFQPASPPGAMQFPAPRRLPLGPLMDFGYEDEVLFPITLNAASTLKAPSTDDLAAHVNWLVCREVCIPGKADLSLPLQVTAYTRARSILTGRRSLTVSSAACPSRSRPLPNPFSRPLPVASLWRSRATMLPAPSSSRWRKTQIQNAAPQPVRSVDGGIEISLKKDENFRTQLAQLNGVLLLGDGTAYEIHAPPGAVAGSCR